MPQAYLAFHFPFLPADRCRLGGAPPDTPFALVERQANSQRLAAVSPAAHAAGLHPGLGLADARARLPQLETLPHAPAADAALLRSMARLATGWSALVALDPPDGLLLEVGRSAHLFGGAEALAAALAGRIEQAGLHQRHALGPTPDAAAAFARHPAAGGDWQRLPVAALDLGPAAEAALRRAGLPTLGAVAGRPRAALVARFGAAIALALDRLTGGVVRPLKPWRQPPRLAFTEQLPEPLLTADGIGFILDRLLLRAVGRMARLGLGGRGFALTLFRTDGACQQLPVESGAPLREAGAIRRLFAERIAGLADPLDPGFGYDAVRLEVTRAEPLGTSQPTLGGEDRATAALEALIDRLSVRFGADRVLRLHPAESHLPERAERRLPAGAGPPRWPLPAPDPIARETPMRPLLLVDPPEPVEVLAEVPDGPPRRFRWRRRQHVVALAEGPERIAPDWWRNPAGLLEGAPPRDYWRVEDSEGRRFWLVRSGLYESGRPPRWLIHGLFA